MKEEETIAKLSNSYFYHILKEVEPFLKIFDINGSFKKMDSETLERLFFMACITSTDIALPFGFQHDHYFPLQIKKNEWLTDLKPFGSKSKQGVVSKSLLFNQFYIVVKKAKSVKFDEITYRDFCVGISLNKILNEAPFFVRTLGGFKYKNQFHIALEYIDGINLKDFIINPKNTFTDFLNIFFQILLGLEVAQNKLNFTHYDLHTDNIILVHRKSNLKISLYGYIYTIKYLYKPVMIDFGLSSVHLKNKTIGQINLESKGIHPHISVGYDIYIFLLFCVDIIQNSNMSILNGILDLLKFFENETKVSMDLLTNNHIKSLQKGVGKIIPHKFIHFLLHNYSSQLNVEFEPQKFTCGRLIKPTFLRLKNVLDVNDEIQPKLERYINIHKGFVKGTLDNIKIYYWYREKVELQYEQVKNLLTMDKILLQNFIDNLSIGKGISVAQKNIFFQALEYYYIIIELELNKQYNFYQYWIRDFEDTFVFKKFLKNKNYLDNILLTERLSRTY